VREIVNDLRQFSSTQESAKAPFDVVHVVKTALHWIVKESKVSIQIDLDLPDQLWAVGHAGQIHQVVVNLIQNAVDAMQQSAHPALIVKVFHSAKAPQEDQPDTALFGAVHLCIKDTGTGVDQANMDKLFDPFFTTKPVGQGTGLGLSISYGIVAQHHGVLTIKNRSEHEGESGVEACLIIPAAAPNLNQSEKGGA
jgi:two-component system sensor histidine kinase HupT/HoxJ